MENKSILKYFSAGVLKALSAYEGSLWEIRLRAGGRLAVTTDKGCLYLNENGAASSDPGNGVSITSDDIRRTFEALCRYSVHSFQNRINQGFITVSGGHRAGICGTAVYSPDGKIENLKYISGINFRVTREVIGAADIITERCMRDRLCGVLIFGEPCSGKTTVLRDLCRQMGDRFPVSLIDERGELAAVSGGLSNNSVGANTDVFSGFSKKDGIITAIRAMSPRLIVCDEIGSEEDISALRLAGLSGVKAAATVHCGSVGELLRRTELSELIRDGIFEYAVHIRDREIKKIYSGKELFSVGQRNGDRHD